MLDALVKFSKVVSKLLIGSMVLAGLVGLTLFLSLKFTSYADNDNFARRYFESIDRQSIRIVGSKRWLSWEIFGCTYAAVQVRPETASLWSQNGPNSIDVRPPESDARLHPWPNTWKMTPYKGEVNFRGIQNAICTDGGSIRCCMRQFSSSDQRLIETALGQSGGWYSEGARTTAFILPSVGIIATIHNGS